MVNPFQSPHPTPNTFLPEDYISRRTEVRANVLMLTLFAIVLAGVVGAFFVTNRHWQNLRVRQEVVSAEYAAEGKKIEQLKALENQRASMMEKAEITAALVEKVPRWAVLGELTLRMPQSMRLDNFLIKSTRHQPPQPAAPTKAAPQSLVKSITGTGAKKEEEKPRILAPRFDYQVTVEGTAVENNDIADFLSSLKRSPVFDRVELQFIRDAKEGGRDMRKFQVTASLRTSIATGELSSSLKDLVAVRTASLTSQRDQENKAGTPGVAPTASAGVQEGNLP
ncbi:MAG: PilN domain-containing protein [Phycisphaeraceae bacterium]|nr:PilN domain-containing protein [Phycisphaeraceae bacterium]